MNPTLKIAAAVALLSLAACAKDQTRPADETADTAGSGTTTSPYTGPSAGSADVTSGASSAAASLPNIRTVYFEFDSSEISGDGQTVVEGWAAYLAANANAKVRLEGHCDERGTREYNVALGERRANAVQQALTSRGVSARQISVTSYGEERPVNDGHDDAAWQQNRRVEIAQ
jgi:peptidoglycan-associated lipoprotein